MRVLADCTVHNMPTVKSTYEALRGLKRGVKQMRREYTLTYTDGTVVILKNLERIAAEVGEVAHPKRRWEVFTLGGVEQYPSIDAAGRALDKAMTSPLATVYYVILTSAD